LNISDVRRQYVSDGEFSRPDMFTTAARVCPAYRAQAVSERFKVC
jgi:hypothetical protein